MKVKGEYEGCVGLIFDEMMKVDFSYGVPCFCTIPTYKSM